MDRVQFEDNLIVVSNYNKELKKELKKLFLGVKGNSQEHKEILEEFLEYIGIESNEETRLCAYFRIVDLHENSLLLYMSKKSFTQEKTDEVLNNSYKFVSELYLQLYEEMIFFIEKNHLLTSFYLSLIKGVNNIGKAFTDFFPVRRKHIIFGINRDLEKEFDNNSEKIIEFLTKNNFFDLGHNGDIADRSYSALYINKDGKYEVKSYYELFTSQIEKIIKELDVLIDNLKREEDNIYNSKQEYIDYFLSIKEALREKDRNKLVISWEKIDEKWMKIKTPIQVCHPMEFYEDKYRKAVSPEWDIRIKKEVFDSKVNRNILSMYEEVYKTIDKDKYIESYNFSLNNQKRVQLYLSEPLLFYSSFYTGLFSAQVVPNDEEASKKFGKKIFAFPNMVLEDKRNRPFMKLHSLVFEKTFLDKYRKYLFGENEIFYQVYDIETIGHEYGHTLWLTENTESIMNQKTGVYKNIEEFKATTGGLVAYFLKNSYIESISEKLLLDHIYRVIGLLSQKKVNELEPYYCEALIHLEILFKSGIINLNDDNKIEFIYNENKYLNVKELYLKCYTELVNIYLEKEDAGTFLSKFTSKEGLYYFPKNKKLKEFVMSYYKLYEKFGNEVDDSIERKDYI